MKLWIVTALFFLLNQAHGFNSSTPLIMKAIPDDLKQSSVENSKQLENSQDQEKDLTNFSHGVLSFERREFEEAKTYLVASLAQVELAPYTYFYLGKIAFELKNYNAAYAAFEEALKFKPQFDLNRNIKLEMARVMLLKNKWPQARQLFLEARRQFKRSELYPEILWNLFVIDFKQNSQSQCMWFRSLFESFPNYENSKNWTLDSATWVYEGKNVNCNMSFISKYRNISQLIALGDYKAVEAGLEIAKTSLPRLDYLELLANYELRAGNPILAFEELQKDYATQSSNLKYLQLFIKVASRAMKHEEALNSYDKIISIEKNLRVKAGFVFRKAFLQYELGQYEKSYDTLMLVQTTFANHPYQGDVTWYLGWTAYLQKKYELALTHFEDMNALVRRKKYIRSRDNYSAERVKYWMAHTYRGLGQKEKAAGLLQEVIEGEKLSYYSFLASAYLPELLPKNKSLKSKELLLSNLSVPWLKGINKAGNTMTSASMATAEVTPMVQPIVTESVSTTSGAEVTTPEVRNYVLKDDSNTNGEVYLSQDQQAELDSVFDHDRYRLSLKRFKLLLKTGFHEDARWELQEIEKKAGAKIQKRHLVQLYRQLDDVHRASRIMTLSFQNERQNQGLDVDPFEVWSQTYPKPHKKSVSGSADQYQVPENLVYSIMRAESFYSQTAMSGVGARGLLQLMPFTASQVSELMGREDGLMPEQLFEPDTNIQIGVKYLNRLLKTFSGDKTLAIAAYNAGPHRAEWWVSQFGGLRQDEFIEHILFLETRNYVKKVLQFNWIYDLLYDNQVSFAEIKSPLGFQLSGAPSLVETWEK